MIKQRILYAAVFPALVAIGFLALGNRAATVEAASSGPLKAGTCTSFTSPFINGHTPSTQTVPMRLPAGDYLIEIITEDGYDGRTHTDPTGQTSERVTILGITTDDLIDGVERHTLPTRTGVTLLNDITELTATHFIAPGASGPNSVYVPSVCFELIPPPPTTQPPTTEPPVTEPPVTEPPTTTVPPTTEPPVTEPPVTVPPVTEPPRECAGYPDNFIPSYDDLGVRLGDLCEPPSCPGNSVAVPGQHECQTLPKREMG